MPVITIPIKITVEVENGDVDLVTEKVLRTISSEIPLSPMAVEVTSPHGVFQEFGTHPASKGLKGSNQGRMSPVRQKFRDWAAVQCVSAAAALGMTTDRFGDMVYNKIMKEGMEEHPFFRPAVYEVVDEVDRYFKKGGGGTEQMARDIVSKAQANLVMHDSVYTGELVNSIVSRKLTDREEISDSITLDEARNMGVKSTKNETEI